MPEEQQGPVVHQARRGPVIVITIDRPKARNALNLRVLTDIAAALAAAEADPDIRAAVLTGGAEVFSAGADVDMLSGQTAATYAASPNAAAFAAIRDTGLPVVAAVSGYCLGGGCEIALGCDLVVASDTAVLGQPEIALGIIPGAGGTQLWGRRAGRGPQALAALTGASVDAFAARRMGLVDRVVPAAALVETAVEIAAGIAARAPLAVRAAKTAMRAGADMPLTAALDHEIALLAPLLASEDAAEGIAAFQDKRPATFKGR